MSCIHSRSARADVGVAALWCHEDGRQHPVPQQVRPSVADSAHMYYPRLQCRRIELNEDVRHSWPPGLHWILLR